ncbi:hypothetical protein IAR55_004340 [Kwoniella newhampshirensis]|uniref:L domain-like protein n=1 Tax=Kwoniella newhampshirensis TaxID=1651941 RepID=A0AAW0YXM4_9TREE
MDKGAARSRKRAAKSAQPAPSAGPSTSQGPVVVPSDPDNDQSGPSSRPRPRPRPPAGDEVDSKPEGKHRFSRKRPRNEEQSKDPALYKPKAIRTAVALIYSQAPFPIPPPAETLTTIRRVDLAGSGAEDVSWLEGTGVTWLSLAGCRIGNGWEAVGSLKELSVLNISGCGLKQLPKSLGRLSKLKAVVAMNNDWPELDPDVVGSWTDLNSLIVSHSPNLSSLPTTLSDLHHLSKLTFSHCPRLTSYSLPDLSSLPLLRDVKMNNLPQLTSLPPHVTTWGTGNLSQVGKGGEDGGSNRLGDGLEVLDLGNCSLPYTAISTVFGLSTSLSKKQTSSLWSHLRSLSLHSNPLAITHPNYSELLQGSLPKLQIIDAKRVVERKKKGQVSESKYDKKQRERKEGKMKPSGANVRSGAIMRQWGGEAAADKQVSDVEEGGEGEEVVPKEKTKTKSKKRERENEVKPVRKRRHREGSADLPTATTDVPSSKKTKHDVRSIPPQQPATRADPIDVRLAAPEALSHTQKDRSGKNQTAVVGVIEVKKSGEEVELTSKKKKKIKAKLRKGGDVGGGVDLKELFGKKDEVVKVGEDEGEVDSGLGLGVGGW